MDMLKFQYQAARVQNEHPLLATSSSTQTGIICQRLAGGNRASLERGRPARLPSVRRGCLVRELKKKRALAPALLFPADACEHFGGGG